MGVYGSERSPTHHYVGERGFCRNALLSRRVLHFGYSRVFFECQHSQASEDFPDGLPKSLSSLSSFKNDIPYTMESLKIDGSEDKWPPALRMWARIVEEHTQCGLTYEKDKLVTISGLARRIKESMKCEYVAGLWRDKLELQLRWDMGGSAGTRPETYQAPSWSWASTTGPVMISRYTTFAEVGNPFTIFEVLGVNVTTTGQDKMGVVTSGTLKLQGRLILVTLHEQGFESDPDFASWIPLEAHFPGSENNSVLCNQDAKGEISNGEELFCLPMICYKDRFYDWVVKGIVLRHSGRKGQFRRVAAFESRDKWPYMVFSGKMDNPESWEIRETFCEEYDQTSKLYTFTII